MTWQARIQSALEERRARDAFRVRRVVENGAGRFLTHARRQYCNFSSNDYLGLSQHLAIVRAWQQGAEHYGVGSGGSGHVSGYTTAHQGLEETLADWLGYPRALLFGSGFLANLAVQQALLEDGDVCVQDRLNHASLIDASRLAGCKLRRYPHLDPEGALRQLKQSPEGAAMLATDGVFSMDGDVAPLRALSLVARMQQALLYVDDAHGVGVRGPDGRGSVAEARLSVEEVPLQLVTLGKALGGYGAVVVGSDALIQHLSETARPYLALYCTQDASVFTSEAYARAFQNQTEWSLRNFARMQGTQRRVGTLDVEAGEGQGGMLAAFVLTQAVVAQARPRLDAQLAELAQADGIVRATLQVTVPALSVSLTAKDAPPPPADAVVLIEGTDPDTVRTVAETLAAAHGVPAGEVTRFAMLWRLGANDD